MFKKTVLMMALVMMASSAFAGPEAKDAKSDRESAEREARAEGIDVAKQVGAKNALDQQNVGELVREMIKSDVAGKSKKANGLADALVKILDVKRTVDGKQVSGRDAITKLAEKARTMRAAGKMTPSLEKDVTFLAEYISTAFRRIDNPNSEGAKVAAKEAMLASQVLDPSWAGAPHDSHIKLQLDSMRKARDTGKGLDVATEGVFMDKYGKKADEKMKDDEGCTGAQI